MSLPIPSRLAADPLDEQEVRRFADFLRLVREAVAAGASQNEACVAIYPDCYPDEEAGGS